MALTFGHNSFIDIEFESTFGTLPTGNWKRVPAVSLDPGVAQPWERLDLVGLAGGRDEPAPMRGLLTVEPRLEVPVDLVNIGWWLRALFGAPTTTGTTDRTHVFGSGAAALPSLSMQHANSQISANPFMRQTGLRADTLDLSFRYGEALQTATIGLAGTNASRAATTASGTPTVAAFTPFTGAVGIAQRDGADLARVVGASLRYSNGLERLREANRAGGAITEAAPGVATLEGSVDLRMDTDTLLADSESAAPVALTFGYRISATQQITFRVEDAYLTRIMPPVRGRQGLVAAFAFRGAFDSVAGRALTVTLQNQQATY